MPMRLAKKLKRSWKSLPKNPGGEKARLVTRPLTWKLTNLGYKMEMMRVLKCPWIQRVINDAENT